MRSRWHHKSLLHSHLAAGSKSPTWLELFFDLIFVAAFIQLGNGLSHHLTLNGVLAVGGVFLPLWVAWTGFAFYVNRFTVDDFTHRAFVLFMMFAVGAMAISAPMVLDGHLASFAWSTSAALALVAAMHMRSAGEVPSARAYSLYWGRVFCMGALLWLIAGFTTTAVTIGLGALATLVILAAPLNRRSMQLNQTFPIDFEHLGERFGLLTLIVLGESFVKILGFLVDQGQGISLYLEASVLLLIICGIWWIYFDDVAGSKIREGRALWIIWLYSHIPLQLGIIVLAVALKKAVLFNWDEPAAAAYRWMLCGSLALVFFAVASIDSVTERRQAELSDKLRVNVRWISGVFVLVLAPAGSAMSGAALLVLVTGVNVIQVIFDMMMAPFEEAEHLEIGGKGIAEIAREALSGDRATQSPKPPPRRDVGDAVRRGIPSSVRSDLYYYFIAGGWARLLAAFAVLFLVSNIFFAALYSLEPGSINNANPKDFADAFFFSVQTMSTIGYGNLSPATQFGNVVVAIEAAFSIIAVAIATGLVFAKVSRPQASVLFANNLVITTLDGKRVMMCRMGNARGNEIVDASVSFTVLLDEISSEGHHMRRLHDLKLQRSRSPMFVLSWSVMHDIDDDSPLADIDWDAIDPKVLLLIVTVTGHDGTYGQTVYSRKLYYPEDLRAGMRFGDIMSQLEDGRLMVDYGKFNDLTPDGAA